MAGDGAAVGVFEQLRAILAAQQQQIADQLAAVEQAESAVERLRAVFAMPLGTGAEPVGHVEATGIMVLVRAKGRDCGVRDG